MNKHPNCQCEGCPLYERPYVPSKVPEDWNGTLIVGEAPGRLEAEKGEPFVGMSGTLLRGVYKQAGGDWERTALANVVQCQPPNNRTPTQDEIERCVGHFNDFRPELVIPTGKVASEFVVGKDYNFSSMRGVRMTNPREGGGWDMVPTWHPAFVLRQPGRLRELLADIRRALNPTPTHLTQQPEFEIIQNSGHLSEVLYGNMDVEMCAWDLETDQVGWHDTEERGAHEILMMGFTFDGRKAYILPGGSSYQFRPYVSGEEGYDINVLKAPTTKEMLNKFFGSNPNYDADHEFIAHNGSFDVNFLHGIGIEARCDFDTMHAHYVLQEQSPHGLKDLAREYFGLHDYEAGLVQKYLKSRNDYYSKAPFDKMAAYCAWDVCVTFALKEVFEQQLHSREMYDRPFQSNMMKISRALIEVEQRGMQIDVNHFNEYDQIMGDEENRLEEAMQKLVGDDEFNPRSVPQVQQVVYVQRGLPVNRRAKVNQQRERQGKVVDQKWSWSTGKEALDHLVSTNQKSGIKVRDGDPFVDLLFKYRRVKKLRSTYVQAFLSQCDPGGRVHPSFNQAGTEVTRLTAGIYLTIPRRAGWEIWGQAMRSGFVATPGNVLLHCDYSQAEMRVAAAESGDPFLLEIFSSGRDIHSEVANAMYGENWTKEQRVMAKMLNFADLYGGTEYSFAEDAGMPIDQARLLVRKRNEAMSDYVAWKREQVRTIREKGYVESRFGFRRRMPLITKANADEARKSSVHAVVAGGAAQLTLLSLAALVEMEAPVVLTVHDSILIDCPEEEGDYWADKAQRVMVALAEKWYSEVSWKADVDKNDDGTYPSRWVPKPLISWSAEGEPMQSQEVG